MLGIIMIAIIFWLVFKLKAAKAENARLRDLPHIRVIDAEERQIR
jgi:hypothetical protein